MSNCKHPVEGRHRAVYSLRNTPGEPGHERRTHLAVVRRLAALMELPFGGECTAPAPGMLPCYLVPDDTIIGLDTAKGMGIRCEADLFGGVVPHPFLATKAITHPLVDPEAVAPPGWVHEFGRVLQHAVLPGYTAFSASDARRAGALLLQQARVRLKPTRGRAGRGQVVVTDRAGLDRAVDKLDPREVATFGIVLEEDLADIVTFSVGQVRVAGLTASYCGTQRLTKDNEGRTVYGGSDLILARGGMDALEHLELSADARLAVARARDYDAAVTRFYTGFCASRRNYDVLLGTDAQRRRRCGVLEQSWRMGGATPAEILALEMFKRHPALPAVRASTVEIYGSGGSVPEGAVVLFAGEDDEVGPITKYARAEPHGSTQRDY